MTGQVSFVVLHYKVEKITDECIRCLLAQNYDNYQIIVVDNHSGNGSLESLQEKYGGNPRVYFVALERNYGFAKANDIGYQIAKHMFSAEFTAVINNDLLIRDPDFCRKVNRIYHAHPFDILGPDIINAVGQHQNPQYAVVTGRREVERLIFKTRVKLALIPAFYFLKRRGKAENVHAQIGAAPEAREGVPLHGACVIFGPRFLQTHEFPFYPDTFLYAEEEILYYLSCRENLTIRYDPEVTVHHMEDVSTDSVVKTPKAKRIFQLKHSLNSLLILQKLMNEAS